MEKEQNFYQEHYDVIVIGASLAGLSAAIKLRQAGKSVLVLERHNLPGGVATSFVRGGVELEATLHEMMEIGPRDARGKSAGSCRTSGPRSTGCRYRTPTISPFRERKRPSIPVFPASRMKRRKSVPDAGSS